jgi:tRNA G26 N,N-dimethylase Trm1
VIRKTIHGNSIHFSAAHFQSNLIQTGCTKQRKEIATNEETGMDQTNQQQQEEAQSKVQTNYGNSKCTHCGGTAIHMGGPIYVAPIHEPEFVQHLLERFHNILE